MTLRVTTLDLSGPLLIEPRVIEDERGFFLESYNAQQFGKALGRPMQFVQDNHSRSARGVLRGLHYQLAPHAQAKLVRVVVGEVYDVVVDLRRASPTFGRWAGVRLSAANRRQLFVPEGFAHGFAVLSDGAEVLYKASGYYVPSSERSVAWNDPDIGIDWQISGQPTLSDKDANAPRLSATETFA